VLVTQCLQNDLLRPLSPTECLPNRMHVGRSEADRLIGRGCSRDAPGSSPPPTSSLSIVLPYHTTLHHSTTQRPARPAHALGQNPTPRRTYGDPRSVLLFRLPHFPLLLFILPWPQRLAYKGDLAGALRQVRRTLPGRHAGRRAGAGPRGGRQGPAQRVLCQRQQGPPVLSVVWAC
jgi:hypothetical protein